MPVKATILLKFIQISGLLHSTLPKKPLNANRLWDNKTPYIVHPLWCATTIAFEQNLSAEVRFRGILTLLFHDVLEDTDGTLPEDLPGDVIDNVIRMTSQEEVTENAKIWSQPPEIRLLKLYDKTSNLLDEFETNQETRKINRLFISELIKDVEQNYGILNITIIAHSLVNK